VKNLVPTLISTSFSPAAEHLPPDRGLGKRRAPSKRSRPAACGQALGTGGMLMIRCGGWG
jgi:hypothetical protein